MEKFGSGIKSRISNTAQSITRKRTYNRFANFRLTSTITDISAGCSEVCCEDYGLFAELEPLLVGGHQLQQGEVVHTLHLYQRQCL
jgi:hypothetical protein